MFKPGVNKSTDKNLLDLIGVATVLTSTGSFLKGDRLAQSITPNSRKGRGRGVDHNPPLCLLTAQLVTQTLSVVITVQSESQGCQQALIPLYYTTLYCTFSPHSPLHQSGMQRRSNISVAQLLNSVSSLSSC